MLHSEKRSFLADLADDDAALAAFADLADAALADLVGLGVVSVGDEAEAVGEDSAAVTLAGAAGASLDDLLEA